MDNFNKNINSILDTLNRTGKILKENAMELKRVANLRYKIYETDKEISNLYKELGIRYYKYNKNMIPDISAQTVMERIDFLYQKKKDLEIILGKYKNLDASPKSIEDKSDEVFCPNCGKIYSADKKRCPYCGS
ncbi:hypothetical protein HMPREF3189_00782 [Clostridiales bacterium KA00134]|nr:hypothetical protein HMPREF3189_00782 [Clostridiales bacterium KA00134]